MVLDFVVYAFADVAYDHQANYLDYQTTPFR